MEFYRKAGYLINHTFLKNSSKLLISTIISQVIGILSYPLLARVYSVSDFGILEVFTSILMIISSVSCLRFDQAILIADTEQEAEILVHICLFFALICSILTLIIGTVWNSEILQFCGLESKYIVLVFSPTLFIVSSFLPLKSYANRLEKFGTIASFTVGRSILSFVFQLVFGYIKNGSLGIILGTYLSYFFSNSKLYLTLGHKFNLINKESVIYCIKKYIDFPKYSVVGTLINSLAIYSFGLFVSDLFGTEQTGQIGMANKLLSIPVALVTGVLGEVFTQRASLEVRNNRDIRHLYSKLFVILFIVGFLGGILAFYIIPFLFEIILGPKWALAAKYSLILISLMSVRFFAVPLTSVFIILKRQKRLMYWFLFQLILLYTIYFFSRHFDLEINEYLKIYVITQIFFYILLTIDGWRISAKN